MKRFSNILLISDLDTDNDTALKRAITLARNNQAVLTACTVVDAVFAESKMATAGITPAELCDIAVTESRDRLEKIVETSVGSGIPVEIRVLVGKPFIEIIRQVLRHNHDLVIKCAEGATGVADMLFGSADMHLCASVHARCGSLNQRSIHGIVAS